MACLTKRALALSNDYTVVLILFWVESCLNYMNDLAAGERSALVEALALLLMQRESNQNHG